MVKIWQLLTFHTRFEHSISGIDVRFDSALYILEQAEEKGRG